MDKYEIIEEIAKQKLIEEILENITKGYKEEWHNDVVQDLYLSLLAKDEQLIQHLYNHNQMKFFVTRMLLNNIQSLNGPAFKDYIKWDMLKSDNAIPEICDEDE